MKKVLALLMLALLPLTLAAQEEQDFASRYLEQHAADSTLQCTTMSPAMMVLMQNLAQQEEDAGMGQILKQLKSIRVLSCTDTAHIERHTADAAELIRAGGERYKAYSEHGNDIVYIRRKGELIVELLLISADGPAFVIVDFTGNMDESFLDRLIALKTENKEDKI